MVTCGLGGAHPEGAASSLSPKSGFAAPLELADPPRNFFGIDRNPGPEPPKEQPIINAPDMYFRRTRGSKSSQKWEFAPKHVLLQSTANGTKVPKTTPMEETLLPCTLGLANTDVPFGLDLPHVPQKHKKTSKFGLFLLFGFSR